jgi:histidinol-phosphate phosphatase family protein
MPGELVLKRREPKRRAVFLDRDGVINALVFHEDAGVIDSPMNEEQFKLLPRVPKAIRLLNEAGVLVIIVSNQPAVARGRYSMEMLERVEHKLENELAKAGARIDAAYYCVHHPTAPILKWRKKCTCRKPGIGMLKKASQRFSFVAGQRAGCKTIFIGRCLCDTCPLQKGGRTNADFTARDLWSAARMIREREVSA